PSSASRTAPAPASGRSCTRPRRPARLRWPASTPAVPATSSPTTPSGRSPLIVRNATGCWCGLQVCLIVPGLQRPAAEVDALDRPVLAVVEDRDPGVHVRDAVERPQVLRGEGLAEDRRAEEEVQEAPVRDAQDALVGHAAL